MSVDFKTTIFASRKLRTSLATVVGGVDWVAIHVPLIARVWWKTVDVDLVDNGLFRAILSASDGSLTGRVRDRVVVNADGCSFVGCRGKAGEKKKREHD
jgi:hypothetical protein